MSDVTGTYMEVGAENRVLRQQLERAEARVVEYRDALQSVSRGNLELQRMLNKKADHSNAFIFRKQADAVESCFYQLKLANTAKGCRSHLSKEFQRLRKQAEEAGGEDGKS